MAMQVHSHNFEAQIPCDMEAQVRSSPVHFLMQPNGNGHMAEVGKCTTSGSATVVMIILQ